MFFEPKKPFSSRLLYTAALAVLVPLVCPATDALAQTVPSSVDVGQANKRLRGVGTVPLTNPDLGLPLPGQQPELTPAQRSQLEKVKFTLKAVSIEGATVFSEEQLEVVYKDKVGKKISLLDAQDIARQITVMYQKAGYILSQAVVPQQEIGDGTLKIQVVEGFVDGLVIEGDGLSEGERSRISSYLEKLKTKRPVRAQDLERYLLLINDLPGATVNGLLRPSATQFGAADLRVTVRNKRYEGGVTVDNRGTKFIGPWQASASGTANSLLGLYERTQLRFATSVPTAELASFELQHEHEIGNEGTKLTLLASRTRTKPGDSLRPVKIVGTSDLVEAKVTHPFIRSRHENLIGRFVFDHINSDTDVFANIDFTEDRLRIARLGADYNVFDGLKANNTVDIEYSQGLNIFNASETGANRTNASGESDFRKFNLDLTRVQPLPDKFSLYTGAAAQYSLDPLLVPEQFSLGGASFGTAYDPAEILGDHGIAGKVELRYSDTADLPYLNYYQLFGYYDIGRTWIRDGAAGANDKRSLASVGGGARVGLNESLSATVEVGVPMTRPQGNQGDHGEDPRFFFGTTARF